jgi:hypothetical protein
MNYLIALLFSVYVAADASRDVFIRGKIGNEFTDSKVKVVDSENQIYFLPRSVFPKDFLIKQGKSFAIEIPERTLNKLKILKK